jgi:hypothetical protein
VMVMIFILEVSGSNHGRSSYLPTDVTLVFPQFIQLDSSKCLKSGQGRFLPCPFQLIIHYQPITECL